MSYQEQDSTDKESTNPRKNQSFEDCNKREIFTNDKELLFDSIETKGVELTKKEKKEKIREIRQMMISANKFFVKNDNNSCISVLKEILIKSPKNANAYFMIGLVFEEMKDLMKAYNFFLIASQLMKTNYLLWEKLYELSTTLNLLSDKIYFIQILQRRQNTKELVEEKLQLYTILKSKYKILETKIELFYFKGVDFNIFNIIRNETKHKFMTARCALYLIKYFEKYPANCGLDFLQNIIRLQYDTGYLFKTRNLIEKYLLGKVILPRDIRIIYIMCVLVNNDPPEKIESSFTDYNIDDIEFREALFEAKESVLKNLNCKDEIFDIYENNNEECSKTLEINSLLSSTDLYEKYSDIDIFIRDLSQWENFTEIEYIKGLLEIFLKLNMDDKYLEVLNILENKIDTLKEYVYNSYGDFYFTKKDFINALFYYQETLKINPDNNLIKSKLYEIYKIMGNIDLANKFRTISSLINFVNDVQNDDKFKFMSSIEKCNENRNIYSKSRLLFRENFHEYNYVVRPLINDFLENRFFFTKIKKVKLDKDDVDPNEEICEANTRLLSLHGLNIDEWSAILLEFIIYNITQSNLKDASHLLKKSLDCNIFKKKYEIFLQFVFLTIKHAIFCNDLNLLSNCFKKVFRVFRDYSWANFYFYLLNFFPDYIFKNSYGSVVRNIRRTFKRNHVLISGIKKKYSSVYESLDLNLLLGTFFIQNIAKKSYKIINNIILDGSVRDRMTYYIILIITYKSRRNDIKNEMLKKGIEGLKALTSMCNHEELCNLSYNIGVTYHLFGYIGFAEKYYLEALKSRNNELRRMARLSLIIIYKKSNQYLLEKLYAEDEMPI